MEAVRIKGNNSNYKVLKTIVILNLFSNNIWHIFASKLSLRTKTYYIYSYIFLETKIFK